MPTSASRAVPSTSSQSAGAAALARLEAQERRGHSSRPHGGVAGMRGQLLDDPEAIRVGGAGGEVKKKPCAALPVEEPVPMEVCGMVGIAEFYSSSLLPPQ